MCGLTALLDFSPNPDPVAHALHMHAAIPHRGPDGEGFCALEASGFRDAPSAEALSRGGREPPYAVLAFRWLQIQDRNPRSSQPMASRDGSLRLLFNGEIYNFRRLRTELEARGHAFDTVSDTEVVLAAYLEWGAGMFERLEGMWAIVLVDLPRRKLMLSRDRFGIKPLYYRLDPGRLLLASEVKQLLAAGVPATANTAAVRRFVRGLRPSRAEETFFDGIEAIPAGSLCEVALDEAPRALEFRRYWDLTARDDAPASLDTACDRLEAILREAVDDHMVACVPVGVLISGGLDSSIIAALSTAAYARRGEPPTGFSMVLPWGDRLDERVHMDRLVASLGFGAHSIELDSALLRSTVGDVTRAQDEPVPGIAVVGQYLTFGLAAAQGVRVVLDGQGADEMFAGYPRHQMAWLAQLWRERRIATLAREGLAVLARDRAALRRSPHRPDGAMFIRDEAPAADPAPTTLDAVLRRDVLGGNLGVVLGLTDRNAMAHSVEARVPYVYRSVAEFAFGLPAAMRLGLGDRKRILRRVAARHVPASIVGRRDRIGFGAPAETWLRQRFAGDLRGLAGSDAFASEAFDKARMARYVEAFLSGAHNDAGTMWRLYAVDQWVRAYGVTGM